MLTLGNTRCLAEVKYQESQYMMVVPPGVRIPDFLC